MKDSIDIDALVNNMLIVRKEDQVLLFCLAPLFVLAIVASVAAMIIALRAGGYLS